MAKRVVIDTETTGLDPENGHRVIEIGCIEFIDSQPTGKVFNLKLNPDGKKSTKTAYNIHRISDSELKVMPRFEEVIEEFIQIVTDAELIAFNAPFDVKFLNAELSRAGYPSTLQDISSKITCVMELSKRKFKLSRVNLNNACRRYNIDVSQRDIHSALLDASLCAKLFFSLIDNSIKPLDRTPQENKHKEPKAISIPRAYIDQKSKVKTQLNFCKNPECGNFGVVAKNPTYKSDGTLNRGLGNNYSLTPKKDSIDYLLKCGLCGQSTSRAGSHF